MFKRGGKNRRMGVCKGDPGRTASGGSGSSSCRRRKFFYGSVGFLSSTNQPYKGGALSIGPPRGAAAVGVPGENGLPEQAGKGACIRRSDNG